MSDDINDELSEAVKVDWTTDPESGRSNSSPAYHELVDEVKRLIDGSAHDLIGGRTESVARLIMAQLAHKHDLAPRGVTVTAVTADEPGNLFGYFSWNGQMFRFEATPLEEPTFPDVSLPDSR